MPNRPKIQNAWTSLAKYNCRFVKKIYRQNWKRKHNREESAGADEQQCYSPYLPRSLLTKALNSTLNPRSHLCDPLPSVPLSAPKSQARNSLWSAAMPSTSSNRGSPLQQTTPLLQRLPLEVLLIIVFFNYSFLGRRLLTIREVNVVWTNVCLPIKNLGKA